MTYPHNLLAVVAAAAHEYGCTPAEIVGPSRARHVRAARRAVCVIARGTTVSRKDRVYYGQPYNGWGMPLDSIARRLGRKGASEVLSMLATAEREAERDSTAQRWHLEGLEYPGFRQRVESIREAACRPFDWRGFCGISVRDYSSTTMQRVSLPVENEPDDLDYWMRSHWEREEAA